MGFEGNSNEINLKQHADKTWTACRQDTEYLVMFHGREESVKARMWLVTSRCPRIRAPKLEHAAWQDGGAVLFLLKAPLAHALLSAF